MDLWVKLTEGPWSRRRKHQAIVLNNELLLLGGFDGESALDLNDVWAWNGESWRLVCDHAAWSGRDGHCAATLYGSIFIIGGTDDPYECKSDVWKSEDGGLNWSLICETASWPQRWQHGACIHNNYMYISGGWGGAYFNDIWKSADGMNWIQVSNNCPWKPRMFHSMISFNGAIYILGGHDSRNELNDIWASSDGGYSWTLVCNSAEWDRRQGQVTVCHGEYAYIMGGFGGSKRYNDVWKSKDCAHWELVEMHSAWSPRQGHACVAYRDSLCLLGGFDHSGYCNNMYSFSLSKTAPLQLNSIPQINYPMNQMSNSQLINQPKTITVSLTCVLDMILKIKFKRVEHEAVIQKLVNVIALVMSAINFLYTYRSLDASSNLELDNVVEIDSVESNYSTISDSSSDDETRVHSSSVLKLMYASRHGSPIRENMKDVKHLNNGSNCNSVSNSPRLARISSDEDLRMQVWNSLASSTFSPTGSFRKKVASSDIISPNHSTYSNRAQRLFAAGDAKESQDELNCHSSAALHELMKEQRRKLSRIQNEIRKFAEENDNENVQRLIQERTSFANSSIQYAKKLLDHIKIVRHMQQQHRIHLSKKIRQLEKFSRSIYRSNTVDTANESSIVSEDNVNTSMTQCTWTEWKNIVEQCSEIINAVSASNTEAIIVNFTDLMRKQSDISRTICEWVDFYSVHSNGPKTDDGGNRNIEFNKSYEELVNDYQSVNDSLDVTRMQVKSAIDVEIQDIVNNQDKSKNLLVLTYEKGCALVRGLITQNSLDTMEITAMKNEVKDWYKKLYELRDIESLQVKCLSLIQENSSHEEILIGLEEDRIDIKSAIEKASFRRRTSTPVLALAMVSSEEALSPTRHRLDSDPDSLLKLSQVDLQNKLLTAEQSVRNTRKLMRQWFRETRQFAIEIAPELFLELPDLRSFGSILGDGGFVEKTNLPRRRFDEYEIIGSLHGDSRLDSCLNTNKIDSIFTGKTYGRHLLLKAKFDNDDVVLKGFTMHEGDQRKGFEREITILSRLKNECIISPNAVVETGNLFNSCLQSTAFIEYPYYKNGNLDNWLSVKPRMPWELQSIARQILYSINFLHDHGVIHKDIKPSNVLMHDDDRVVLTDFELSREVSNLNTTEEDASISITNSGCQAGTRVYMSPEIERGDKAVYASDMYSFGILLFYMHFPDKLNKIVPGYTSSIIPASSDMELSDLLEKLIDINPNVRPSAVSALMHPYFRSTFVEKLLQDGEVVEQDRKLEAVRSMLHKCRLENKNSIEKITVHRNNLVRDVLDYFRAIPLERIKANLKVIFVGEPGVDEGGLLTEMFSIFYDSIFQGVGNLFESCESYRDHSDVEEGKAYSQHSNGVVLPTSQHSNNSDCLADLRAVGIAMVKSLYEGRRIGSKLCPSVFKFLTNTNPNMRDLQIFDPQTSKSLQWTLATIGVGEFGLHFESVGSPELGVVDDTNKNKFVTMKINNILVDSRLPQLKALKSGFIDGMKALSVDASPFLSLLSHTDWRVLLCGVSIISGSQIVSVLKFFGYPKKSLIPEWLKEILLSSSEDHLRQFLVFVTGSPSLPVSVSSGKTIDITVRYQARSSCLPIAHTCFFQLDIPDYRNKEILQQKLMYAIQNSNTFEIV